VSGDTLEVLNVGCYTPTITTVLSDSSIFVGESVYDNVSFTGLDGFAPTVNISFQYWNGAVWVEFDNQTLLLVNGATNLWTAHSDDFEPDAAGDWKLRAYYPGDDSYCEKASADEPFTVIKPVCTCLQICKETTPNCDPTDFTFIRSYGSQFILSDGECKGSWVLAPGRYTVEELAKPGWALDRIVISGDYGPTKSYSEGYRTIINVDIGERITVTYYDKLIPTCGCTYTWGYWKNHMGNACQKADPTWAKLSEGPHTPFFGTGHTYMDILNMNCAQGNAYIILAHQYIAAQLNGLKQGTLPGPIYDQMALAEHLLNKYPCHYIPKCGDDRADALCIASTLANFNEGYYPNWPHCCD
jgi:hypothetical protein